jgi:hypothetical protein
LPKLNFMRRDPSFEHVIFSMTLSVQFSSYVQHIGNTTFPCSHHASTTFSYFPFRDKFSYCLWVNIFFKWRFSFWLKITLKKFHVGFRTVSFLMSRSTFRTFRIQKYINKINSDQRCTIISVNNYQLQLNFGHDMVTCLK